MLLSCICALPSRLLTARQLDHKCASTGKPIAHIAGNRETRERAERRGSMQDYMLDTLRDMGAEAEAESGAWLAGHLPMHWEASNRAGR